MRLIDRAEKRTDGKHLEFGIMYAFVLKDLSDVDILSQGFSKNFPHFQYCN